MYSTDVNNYGIQHLPKKLKKNLQVQWIRVILDGAYDVASRFQSFVNTRTTRMNVTSSRKALEGYLRNKYGTIHLNILDGQGYTERVMVSNPDEHPLTVKCSNPDYSGYTKLLIANPDYYGTEVDYLVQFPIGTYWDAFIPQLKKDLETFVFLGKVYRIERI